MAPKQKAGGEVGTAVRVMEYEDQLCTTKVLLRTPEHPAKKGPKDQCPSQELVVND